MSSGFLKCALLFKLGKIFYLFKAPGRREDPQVLRAVNEKYLHKDVSLRSLRKMRTLKKKILKAFRAEKTTHTHTQRLGSNIKNLRRGKELIRH